MNPQNNEEPQFGILESMLIEAGISNGALRNTILNYVSELTDNASAHTRKRVLEGQLLTAQYDKQEILRENEADAIYNIDAYIENIKAQLKELQ